MFHLRFEPDESSGDWAASGQRNERVGSGIVYTECAVFGPHRSEE
jgi:hypothetical protein